MKTTSFLGMMAAAYSFISGLFTGRGTGWKRNKTGFIRETHKNDQAGCVHNKSYQPIGRAYAKGAGGSIGRGINPRFDKSAFCRGYTI